MRRRTGTVLGAEIRAGLADQLRRLLAPGGVRLLGPWPAALARLEAGEQIDNIPGWKLREWVPGLDGSTSRTFTLTEGDQLLEHDGPMPV